MINIFTVSVNQKSGMLRLVGSHTYSILATLPKAKTQAQRLAGGFFLADFRRKAASSARFNSEKDIKSHNY